MTFQGYQGEVNPQVGHEIPGAEQGAQMMQLTQIQLAQIISSAVSQALTQHVQQISLAAAASTAAVQQVQSAIKFDVPVFEGNSPASWFTWSQRVIYQARACGFGAELTAAEREELSVGADVFDGSNIDPMRLRNAHVKMTLINNCRGVALETLQRSK